jgi:hypothetical protein
MCRLHILSCGHVHIRLVINSTSSLDYTDDRDGSTYLSLHQIDCKYHDLCLSDFHVGVVYILPCYIHVPRRLVSNVMCCAWAADMSPNSYGPFASSASAGQSLFRVSMVINYAPLHP